MFDIILRGGTVVTPHGVAVQDVVVKGELIEAITNPNAISSEKAKRCVDTAGKIVIPGGIDPHVHCKWHMPMPDGSSTVIIQGKRRFRMIEMTQIDPFMRASVEILNEQKFDTANKELNMMFKNIKDLALQIIKDSPNIPSEAQFAIKNIDSPTFLVNFISSNMNADVSKKQEMFINK